MTYRSLQYTTSSWTIRTSFPPVRALQKSPLRHLDGGFRVVALWWDLPLRGGWTVPAADMLMYELQFSLLPPAQRGRCADRCHLIRQSDG